MPTLPELWDAIESSTSVSAQIRRKVRYESRYVDEDHPPILSFYVFRRGIEQHYEPIGDEL